VKFSIQVRSVRGAVLFEHEAEANTLVKTVNQASCAGADLSRADFRRKNLAGADFAGVNLYRADFSRANLRRACLTGANLSSADLARANLRGADLSGANLSGVRSGPPLCRSSPCRQRRRAASPRHVQERLLGDSPVREE
jgi:uncharacterized protein YjbI with pentapeptide repeats